MDDIFSSNQSTGLEVWQLNDPSAYRWIIWAQTIIEPFIITLGIVGNILATITLLTKELRATSCCLYLTAKCIGDAVFLVALTVVWLYRVHVRLINNAGICQITVFLTYASSFTSVWLIVLVAHENYVRIARPQHVSTVCTPRRAATNIGIVLLSAAIIYNVCLWTTEVTTWEDGSKLCVALSRYGKLLASINVLDLVLTLIIPVLLVSALMLFTFVAVIQAARRQSRLSGKPRRDDDRFHSAEAKVARFLTIVSLTLLFFHCPSHVIRLKLLIVRTTSSVHVPDSDPALQRAFEVMYYLNFSANLAIYALAGENFRRTFLATFAWRRCLRRGRRGLPLAGAKSLLLVPGRKKLGLESESSAADLELSLVYSTYENISYVHDTQEQCPDNNLLVRDSAKGVASSASSISIL